MAIYAAFRVPEVWRCDGATLRAHLLQAGRLLAGVRNQPDVPEGSRWPASCLFCNRVRRWIISSMVRAFRAWVREQLARS